MRFHVQRFISLNKFYSIWFLAKVHLSQKFFFISLKTVRLCAAHKRMKMTNDKKVSNTSVFFAPMRMPFKVFLAGRLGYLKHKNK